jgi:glutamate-ammonia-ligase adenylyltransferase
LGETERLGGAFPGEVAVIALGKAGSQEMTAGSDLDLMTLYQVEAPDTASEIKGWGAETFYARFAQRLITALSAPTAEGGLYTVDLRLRPTGRAGPVAVTLGAFERYYAAEAETWEQLALTRARVVWASSREFAHRATAATETALRRTRNRRRTKADVLDMRALMAAERPASGDWDLKLNDGGLVDIEFASQFLQIVHAAQGGPLRPNTGEALAAFAAAGLANPRDLERLESAWRLQQSLSQVLKLALPDAGDPEAEPPRFRALLAKAGHARSFEALKAKLRRAQVQAHAAFLRVVR